MYFVMRQCRLSKVIALYTASILAISSGHSTYANPQGGDVVAGDASINHSDNKLDIYQQSQKTVINWDSFNIEIDEHTQFHQPSSDAIALNRVQSHDPSHILGKLTANGNIILINPNGVFYGQNAVVDVNSLITSTADINTEHFIQNDILHFDQAGDPNAAIVNLGTITAKEAGLVGLVAPTVLNNGVINAKLGKVHLASGDKFTLDMYGHGLYEIGISDDVSKQFLSNAGHINAEGGVIAITAAAGEKIVNNLISIEGELHAPTIEENQGKIIIAAAGSNAVEGNKEEDKNIKEGESTVLVSAWLDASGHEVNEQGGSIEITGDNIGILANTVIDTSGYSAPVPTPKPDEINTATANLTTDGKIRTEEEFLNHENRAGGSIKIGGDYLGSGDTPTAKNLYVDSEAYILNDAIESGDGGRTIFWSDDTTNFNGVVQARGGKNGGNGGFLETSGKEYLNAQGKVDLSTQNSNYSKGKYFLDPDDIYIFGNVDPRFTSSDGTTVDLDSDLTAWIDPSDLSTVELTYSTNQLSSAAVTGTSGTNTLETTSDLDLTNPIRVGSRVRISAAGTVTTADTMGGDTYTVAAISYGSSKTTITTVETLTQTYTSQTLYRGLVSQIDDKSSSGIYDATQTVDSQRPLFISDYQNGNAVIHLEDDDPLKTERDLLDIAALSLTDSVTLFSIATPEDSNQGQIINTNGATTTGTNYILEVNSTGHFAARTYNPSDSTTDVRAIDSSVVTPLQSYILTGRFTDNVGSELFVDSSLTATSTNSQNLTGNDGQTARIGSQNDNPTNGANFFDGEVGDVLFYDSAISDNARSLVEQYISTKWGKALSPSGSGATEAAKAMASTARGDGADGYSVFSTAYLEYLSESADIDLQAGASITLDLQGDQLDLSSNQSITLTTNDGNISTASTGSIVATGTGDITFTAGGSGNMNFNHALTLGVDTGTITLNAAGDDINFNSSFNTNGDDITINATNTLVRTDTPSDFSVGSITGSGSFTFEQSTVSNSLGVGTGGSHDISLSDALITKIKSGFDSYIFGRSTGGDITNYTTTWGNPVSFLTNTNFINAAAISSTDTVLVQSGADITLNEDIATTSSDANAIVLDASGDFLNTAGSNALSATNSRWLVFSDSPVGNTNNGLLPTASEFNKNYSNIGTVGANNRFIYATSTQPTITYNVDNASVEYGDAYSGGSLTYSSGLVGDDSIGNIGLTGSASFSDTYSVGDNAGTYNNILSAATNTLANVLGYQFAFNDGDLTVTKALLTATVGDDARTYGDANPSFTVNYSGFKNSEDSSVLTSGVTAATTATTASNVGDYDITLSGGAATNYSFDTTDTGTLTINKADLLVTAADKTREYGDANPTLTFSYSGFKNSEDENVLTATASVSTAADTNSNAGDYDITVNVGTNDNTNYNLVANNGTLTIDKAALTTTVADASREYGQANPSFTISYSGFKLTDTVAVLDTAPTASTTATTSSAAGSYDITIAGGSDNNYSFMYNNPAATLTITGGNGSTSTDTITDTEDLPNTVVSSLSVVEMNTDTGNSSNNAVFIQTSTQENTPSSVGNSPFKAPNFRSDIKISNSIAARISESNILLFSNSGAVITPLSTITPNNITAETSIQKGDVNITLVPTDNVKTFKLLGQISSSLVPRTSSGNGGIDMSLKPQSTKARKELKTIQQLDE